MLRTHLSDTSLVVEVAVLECTVTTTTTVVYFSHHISRVRVVVAVQSTSAATTPTVTPGFLSVVKAGTKSAHTALSTCFEVKSVIYYKV